MKPTFPALLFLGFCLLAPRPAVSAELRIGMIGLDTSHVTAFTSLLNDTNHKDHVPGGRVVVGFKGGSPDIPSSRDRVEGYTKQLQTKYGVVMVDTIEELCRRVDVVMIESVDGRPHLEQARPVIRAGKPVFIDKPVAGSLKDAIEIYRMAREHNVPVFTSSSYRYYQGMKDLLAVDVGDIRSVISFGPCSTEPHHPDLYWYGVHPTEALYTVMGTGCQSVVRTSTDNTDVVTGIWDDGRVGTLQGLRNGKTPHQVIIFGTKTVAYQEGGHNYAPLIREVMTFFKTKKPPVSAEETIEMFAFMEAADESKRRNGKPVSIAEVLKKNGYNKFLKAGKASR